MRDKAHSELLAGLLDQLKATKEADGSRLFDHVALAFGSNIRSIHYLNNPPTLISGGGANLKLGQNLVLNAGTPLNNVWLTLLQGVGVQRGTPRRQHGRCQRTTSIRRAAAKNLAAATGCWRVPADEISR